MRLQELDSIRGLAAISVVIGHILLIVPFASTYIEASPLRIFWAGGEAVILFFILSGLVLSLPLYNIKGKFLYKEYLIKRFFRIYTPYIFWLVFSFYMSSIFLGVNIPELGEWFNGKWGLEFDWSLLLQHLFLIGNFPTTEVNPVVWSLVHEIRISIIFPLLVLIIKRIKSTYVIVLAVSCSIVGFLGDSMHLNEGLGYKNSYFDTLHYTSMFIMGALLAKKLKQVKETWAGLSTRLRIVLFCLGLVLYTYSKGIYYILNNDVKLILIDWGVMLGSLLIIISALGSNKISKVLNKRILLFNGRISYSMYLCHVPILLIVFHNTYGLLPNFYNYFVMYLMYFCLFLFI